MPDRIRALPSLKPTRMHRVIDLVSAAGIDVSDWANFKGGERLAATNPKYCYEWSYIDPGRLVVLNIWYQAIEERNGAVFVELNLRKFARECRDEGRGVERSRAERFDSALQEAANKRLAIRLIIIDGKRRSDRNLGADASRVSLRLLDEQPWAIDSYNQETGDCKIIRGARPSCFVDQFSSVPGGGNEADRHPVSGTAFDRNPALRQRALERAKGLCEYCKQVGFATPGGGLFLETHHVIPLGESGSDSEDNIVAICPNHHREAHYGSRRLDIRRTLIAHLGRLFPRASDNLK